MPVKNASGRVRQHIWYTSNTNASGGLSASRWRRAGKSLEPVSAQVRAGLGRRPLRPLVTCRWVARRPAVARPTGRPPRPAARQVTSCAARTGVRRGTGPRPPGHQRGAGRAAVCRGPPPGHARAARCPTVAPAGSGTSEPIWKCSDRYAVGTGSRRSPSLQRPNRGQKGLRRPAIPIRKTYPT